MNKKQFLFHLWKIKAEGRSPLIKNRSFLSLLFLNWSDCFSLSQSLGLRRWRSGLRPTWKKIFTHIKTSPLPAKGCKFCSALMAIEQWGFFSVLLLLWHGTSVYNGHLRGPVTLTPITERLAVDMTLPVFTT